MKKIFTLLLLATLLLKVQAVPENNPPICNHSYVLSSSISSPSFWIQTTATVNKGEASLLPSIIPGSIYSTYICNDCGDIYADGETRGVVTIECKDWNGNIVQNIVNSSYSILELQSPITINTGGIFDLKLDNNTETNGTLKVTVVGDDDNDGIDSHEEILTYNTDPYDADSDNDGLNDGNEVNLYGTNPSDADSDDDGLNDGAEILTHETDPNDSDSDDDGLNDGNEINTSNTDPNDADSDDDGLSDGAEVNTHSTNPNNPDQDGDGWIDGYEIDYYNSLNNTPSEDNDTDGFSNYIESILELNSSKTSENSNNLNLIIY
jgi:hypothetical protein